MSGCVNKEIPSIIIDYMVLPVSQVVSHLDKTCLCSAYKLRNDNVTRTQHPYTICR